MKLFIHRSAHFGQLIAVLGLHGLETLLHGAAKLGLRGGIGLSQLAELSFHLLQAAVDRPAEAVHTLGKQGLQGALHGLNALVLQLRRLALGGAQRLAQPFHGAAQSPRRLGARPAQLGLQLAAQGAVALPQLPRQRLGDVFLQAFPPVGIRRGACPPQKRDQKHNAARAKRHGRKCEYLPKGHICILLGMNVSALIIRYFGGIVKGGRGRKSLCRGGKN